MNDGRSDDGTADLTLPDRLERLARTHTQRTAVASDAWQASYAELNTAANALAHAVLAKGGARGDRIAILMQHEAPLIAAVIAVLKAGRVAVILNTSDPPARLRQIAMDAKARLVVADRINEPAAGALIGNLDAVVPFNPADRAAQRSDPDVAILPDDAAILMYTSGSTGEPKVLARSHRQVLHQGARVARALALVPNDRTALLFALSGEMGVTITISTLLSGASLHLFSPMERGVTGLAEWLQAGAISVLHMTPSLFRLLVRTLPENADFPDVRVLRLGTEHATSQDFGAFQQHFSDACTFVHTFGSTETNLVAYWQASRRGSAPKGRLPIGRPAEGVEIFVVDESGREAGGAETGEIVVRAGWLANDRDAAAADERYCEWPPGSGSIAFRTGDFGRRNAEGVLEFIGRKDTRIKVRGYRIELSEIELALTRLNGIEQAVVTCDQVDGNAKLVAFVVPRDGERWSAGAVQRALRFELPRYMVPSHVVFLDRLPLTPHGKVDREQLRRESSRSHDAADKDKPATETEALLARIWADVLECDVGREDDFFELGGDSLDAASLSASVHAELGIDLSLGMLAAHPTLAELAKAIDEMRRAGTADNLPPIVRVSREGPLPLSFFQQRAWEGSQTAQGLAAYSGGVACRIMGPLDREILHDCIRDVIWRHEILRTVYPVVDGRPIPIVQPPSAVPLPFLDLAGDADAEEKAALVFKNELAHVFDLARGPLIRFSLVRTRENEHLLTRFRHHIQGDARSWSLILQELGLLYEAKLRGEDRGLPECEPLQYCDFAVWQRQVYRRDGPVYRASIAWWSDFLAGAPRVLDLPFKRATALPGLDRSHGVIGWGIDHRVSQQLAAIGRAQGATFYMVRLAAFVALVASETGRNDVVLGSYMANRPRRALQGMLGFFVNLVIFRARYDPHRSFRGWLSLVRDRVAAIEAHGAIPHDELIGQLEKQGAAPPYLQATFNASRNRDVTRFADLELVRVEAGTGGMPWGFNMQLDESDEQNGCETLFDAGIYDPTRVRKFVDRYRRLLDAIGRSPDDAVGQLVAKTEKG